MRRGNTTPACVFSVDVEDWFHILDLPSAPRLSEWDRLPARVERNFRRLLEVFHEAEISVTCFFLGWIAQRYAGLVREAQVLGHEIASHGFAHELLFDIGEKHFIEDVRAAKRTIEDIAGRSVLGYRAPGFSVNERTPWFFDALEEAGYVYDSSVFPARRRHGGFLGASLTPYRAGGVIEFPISVRRVLGVPVCFFGGGYLRLSPLWLIKRMADSVLGSGRFVNFYLHPRDIDADQPRLPMSSLRRFQTYINLASTEKKIEVLARSFRFVTFEELYLNLQAEAATKSETMIHAATA